jgi:hypothetical protein
VLRRLAISRRALVPLAVVAGLVVSLPAGAAGSKSFADPAGDSGPAPDITAVVVSNDDRGILTFALTFANRTSLVADDRVVIGLDVDRSRSTGSSSGVDYLIVADNQRGTVRLARWNGSVFDVFQAQTLRAVDWKTFTIDRAELNGTSAFNFLVQAGTPAGFAQPYDEAPDRGALWIYELQLAGEAVEEVSLEVKAVFKPAAPRAGSVFSVTRATIERASGGDIGLTALACKATITRKTLRPLGRCRWRIPRSARGKTLVVVVEGGYKEDRIVSEPFRFRIR